MKRGTEKAVGGIKGRTSDVEKGKSLLDGFNPSLGLGGKVYIKWETAENIWR